MPGIRAVSYHRIFVDFAAGLGLLVGVLTFGVEGAKADLALSCPLASQCTTITDAGHEVTFSPIAPGTANSTRIAPSQSLSALACPSASQCTAVDRNGQEVTFDPMAPGYAAPVTIDVSSELSAVTCPSASQCTAVDQGGQEVTFDPTAPGNPTPVAVDSSGILPGVACPSVSQCTTIDRNGREITFNPTAPSTQSAAMIDKPGFCGAHCPEGYLIQVVCPSVSQCTAIDDQGGEFTFAPSTPGTPTPTNLDDIPQEGPSDLACPSVSQCTALYGDGETTFNPQNSGNPTMTQIGNGPPANEVSLYALACPSSGQCTAVDGSGGEVTFDPTMPSCVARAMIYGGGYPRAVTACEGKLGIGRIIVHGARTRVATRCKGLAWAPCSITLRLTAMETIKRGKVITISSSAAKPHNSRRKTVVLGAVTAVVPAGRSTTLSFSLNATGRRLLIRRHRLQVKLTISQSGHIVLTRAITFTAFRRRRER
jgi:hypothetical protein